MLAMSESVDRRYFKAVFFNTIRRKAAVYPHKGYLFRTPLRMLAWSERFN
jgi:hypothetical protein